MQSVMLLHHCPFFLFHSLRTPLAIPRKDNQASTVSKARIPPQMEGPGPETPRRGSGHGARGTVRGVGRGRDAGREGRQLVLHAVGAGVVCRVAGGGPCHPTAQHQCTARVAPPPPPDGAPTGGTPRAERKNLVRPCTCFDGRIVWVDSVQGWCPSPWAT